MSEYPYAGVYWGPRKESLEDCAARLEVFLRNLARIDSLLAHWYDTGWSRKDALQRRINLEAPALRELLLAGKSSSGRRKQVNEAMGFLKCLWNGRDGKDGAGLDLACGSHSRRLGNFCTLDFSEEGPAARRLLRAPVVTEVLKCMIHAWEPEEGVVGMHAYHDLRPDSLTRSPRIGWVTYLPRTLGPMPPLSPPAITIPVDQQGALVIATDERFTTSNPAHVTAADRVLGALENAGLRTRR